MSLKTKLAQLTPEQKALLLAKVKQQKKPSWQHVDRNKHYPLLSSQKRLWFIDKLYGGSAHYHIPFVVDIHGPLAVDVLQATVDALLGRHEVLRTEFIDVDGEPMQRINPVLQCPLIHLDSDSERETTEQISRLVKQPFDLTSGGISQGPLIRFALIKRAAQENTLVIVVHHIIFDAWSAGILFDDLISLYQAGIYQLKEHLPAPEFHYLDYAALKITDNQQAALAYWSEHLQALPLQHSLPLDRSRREGAIKSAENIRFELAADVASRLKHLATQHQTSSNVIFAGMFSGFLARWSQSEDIVIGSPVANRQTRQVEGMIGFFVNNLVYRTQVSPASTANSLIQDLHAQTMAGMKHADLPFESLVEYLNPERSPLHAPIYQISINYQKATVKDVALADLSFAVRLPPQMEAKYDLMLSIVEHQPQDDAQDIAFALELQYDSSIFDSDTMALVSDALQRFIAAAMSQPECQINQLDLKSTGFDVTTLAATAPQHLIEALSEQVLAQPHALAFVSDSESVSYQQLMASAQHTAGKLRDLGVTSGDVVALELGNGRQFVQAVVAILLCNATYLGLDPKAPAARKDYIVKDSGAVLRIDQALLMQDPQLFALSSDVIRHEAVALQPSYPAYICYTSGTTGKPKGTMIGHGAVVDLSQTDLPLAAGDRVLMLSNIAFDAISFELWCPLLNGATICHYDEPRVELSSLCRLIERQRIDLAFITTALFTEFSAWLVDNHCPSGLKHLLVGGEVVAAQTVQAVYNVDAKVQIYNIYGPTENTTFSTYYPIKRDRDPARRLPIGRCLRGTKGYVVNDALIPQPVGMIGELLLAGNGLATGYLNNPTLTDEKFIYCDFAPGQRLYRSGDLVVENSRSEYVFLGRKDRQVKFRGFRIELDEIANCLRAEPGIVEAVVLLDTQPQLQRLIAYYSGPEAIAEVQLHQRISTRLPEYMHPAAFVWLVQLPKNHNGKLDLPALPAPVFEQQQMTALSGTQQLTLAGIWRQLLSVDTLGQESHFFKLGGHSLLALKLLAQIKAETRADLTLADLFNTPVLAEQAALIDHAALSTLPALVPQSETGVLYQLSFAQQRLWMVTQLQQSHSEFHMPVVISLSQIEDFSRLERAISLLVARHGALRTRFVEQDGEVWQQLQPAAEVTVTRLDATLWSQEALDQAILELIAAPFDLLSGDVLHVTWLAQAEDSGVLVCVIHHMVCDGVSTDLLGQDLIHAYQQAAMPQGLYVNRPILQYADFSQWQRQWLTEAKIQSSVDWWQTQLSELPVEHKLPLDYSRPSQVSTLGGAESLILPGHQLSGLRQLAQASGTSLFVVFQSCFALLLSRYSRDNEVVFGTPVANRDELGLEQTVGLFLNNLVLRHHLQPQHSLLETLAQFHQTTTDALAHQHVPFEAVVEAANPPRSLTISPLFQILINHQKRGEGDNFNSDDGLQLSILGSDALTAKYDLTLYLVETPDSLKISFNYQTALFAPQTIAAMLASFHRLIEAFIATPERSLESLLNDAAAKPVLVSGPEMALPAQNLSLVLKAVCRQEPHRMFLQDQERSLSRETFWSQVEMTALALERQGLKTQDVVAVAGSRSCDYVVACAAVLLAGGVILPVDSQAPVQRLAHILDDAGVQMLLTIGKVQLQSSMVHIPLESLQMSQDKGEFSGLKAAGSDTAYLVYTSGSTGAPKGVAGTHQGLVNRVAWMGEEYPYDEGISVHITEFGFIRAMWELFAPLLAGHPLRLLPSNYFSELGLFSAQLAELDCARIVTAPSILKASLGLPTAQRNGFAQLRYWFVSGEAFPVEVLTAAQKAYPNVRFINLYGSTEVTSDVTHAPITVRPKGVGVPLGKPIANTQILLLDQHNRAVSCGIKGEIAVAGANLANGYYRDTEKSRASFVNIEHEGEIIRVYKTGDLGRFDHQGHLWFYQREDAQISIRGFRVELGEIQHALGQLDFVEQLAVIAQPHETDGHRLIAFVCSSQDWLYQIDSPEHYQGVARAREQLAGLLPHYMLPAQMIPVSEIPLCRNGKVDNRALEQLALKWQQMAKSQLPESQTEQALAQIFLDLLGVESVALDDSFFELGGNSLLATRLIARISRQFELELPLKLIFSHPSVRWLAQAIDDAGLIADLSSTELELEEMEEFEL